VAVPTRLDERIPETGFRPGEDPLDAFLAWVGDQGLSLYAHQEEAILEIFSGNHVILDTPTGSGKSLVATALHFRTFAALGRAWYTAPIKALVSEKFFELCRAFGPEHVGMMTGDGTVNRDAPIICCTAEILANLALREGPEARVTSVVMDEFHYYADRDRGMAWQIPLLTLPKTQFLLLSATLGDTTAIREDLAARTERPAIEVKGATRPVPLAFEYSQRPEHEALRDIVRGGRAPVYVVHFTQNAATEQAQALTSIDWCTKEEKRAIADAVRGFGFHSPFGQTMRRYVLHGIGLHHAGLLPRYRLLVERLAQQGLLKVICGTDTLGVGINVPIRTVLFTQLCKFDGEKVVILPVREFKQIAGRAGRAGFDSVGYVVVQAPAWIIENATIKAGDKKKKVKAQAPTKGYKHWDEGTFQALVERPPEPLESRFQVDHGRLLLLMQHAEETTGDAKPGYERLLALIEASHSSPAKKAELRQQAEALVGHLEMADLLVRGTARWVLTPGLQHDFSLHHSLSLFLISALAALDPNAPTHALDVLTRVESILEQPRVILQKQVDRAKTALMAELKANGVPFEERIEALEEVTWPKPSGREIYDFFAAYQRTHPWLVGDAVRPKSIAREMVETYASFSEYVHTLGLHRSEGVLLRYLSEVYKALIQNVPATEHTDALLDVIAFLRAMLGQVDASLVTEWEALLAGEPSGDGAARPVDISSDPRLFRARVRAELHALVKALSRRDWEEAAAAVRPDDTWDPEAFAAALAPFHAAYGEVGFDHRARAAAHTHVARTGPHHWEVRQAIFPPAVVQVEQFAVEGHADDEIDEGSWEIRGVIDLGDDTNPTGPLLRLVSIGD
jgi:superfamily II RNA helicase